MEVTNNDQLLKLRNLSDEGMSFFRAWEKHPQWSFNQCLAYAIIYDDYIFL